MMEPVHVSQTMNGIRIVGSAKLLIVIKIMLLVRRIAKVNVYAYLAIGGI